MLVHGVHAIANAAPASNGPPRPASLVSDSECHWKLSASTNGVARNIAPIATISTPPAVRSVPMWLFSSEPTCVAVSPSRMKISEKLATNSRLGTSTRRVPACLMSAGATPMTVER